MTTTSIDAGMVKEIFLAGAANLEAKKEWINDLNVSLFLTETRVLI